MATACKCGHTKVSHPESHDEACKVCDCPEFIPAGLNVDSPTLGSPSAPVSPLVPLTTTAPPVTIVAAAAAPTVDQLIAAAKRSKMKRTVGLAEKIETLAADLRARLAEERKASEEERRREAAAEATRAEIAELERKLAAARAKLPARIKHRGEELSAAPTACPDCEFTGSPVAVGVHRARKHGYRSSSR